MGRPKDGEERNLTFHVFLFSCSTAFLSGHSGQSAEGFELADLPRQ